MFGNGAIIVAVLSRLAMVARCGNFFGSDGTENATIPVGLKTLGNFSTASSPQLMGFVVRVGDFSQ